MEDIFWFNVRTHVVVEYKELKSVLGFSRVMLSILRRY